MASYAYRIVNVFAETPLSGNPLAVFEDARSMDDATMQALALQFNLSETTFILPSRHADARVRIFTPAFEMPFAGHPTLGTAHVVRSLGAHGNPIRLEMRAGVIPVEASGDRWTLTANPPRHRPTNASREDIASALGIAASDIAGDPLWVDTGSEQLIIPLRDSAAVDRCQPDAALLTRHCANERRAIAYVWARESDRAAHVRFFFLQYGSVVEDPGTGSACANLGGYFLATGQTGPLDLTLRQGERTGRPCALSLRLDEHQRILVGGRVIDLGGGTINLP
jgi:trans-2,3-dihydro-3-hydroxyanthranilate isomerase